MRAHALIPGTAHVAVIAVLHRANRGQLQS